MASVRLTPDEAWDVIVNSHTGILTTLRRDGLPVTLPVWFVVDGVGGASSIALRTPSGTKKITRIHHDPRASFLVESGERWLDLRAVHLTGRVEMVDDPDAVDRVTAALDEKYAAFRPQIAVPERTTARYAVQSILRFVPDERILSWDNARIMST